MKVVFHDDFYKVYTTDPAASAGRMEAIMAVIESHVDILTARPAKQKDILKAHTQAHIENIRRAGLYNIAALAAGGAIQTAVLGLDEPAFGLIRPPGHHASRGGVEDHDHETDEHGDGETPRTEHLAGPEDRLDEDPERLELGAEVADGSDDDRRRSQP